MLPYLKQHFGTLFVSRSTVDTLDRMVARSSAELGQNTLSIGWQNGEYVRHVALDAQVQAEIDQLSDLKAKILAENKLKTSFCRMTCHLKRSR